MIGSENSLCREDEGACGTAIDDEVRSEHIPLPQLAPRGLVLMSWHPPKDRDTRVALDSDNRNFLPPFRQPASADYTSRSFLPDEPFAAGA